MNVNIDEDNAKDSEENNMENIVGFIEVKNHKGQTNMPLDIAFSQSDNKQCT
jgi:hypothetical protein